MENSEFVKADILELRHSYGASRIIQKLIHLAPRLGAFTSRSTHSR